MNRILILLPILILFACGDSQQSSSNEKGDQETLKMELDKLEKELQNTKSMDVDVPKAKVLIEKSIQYIDAFPASEFSGDYLFRAAEVCVGIKDYDNAISYWERMKTEYADHEKTPIALFLQGFTADNHMRNTESAKKYYNEFLIKHPNHEFEDQVKGLLKNIDISPEDLVKSFKSKQQKE